jgi:hypothetical protein
MIRVIQHNCARSYEWTIAALETGVEHRVDLVCIQVPLSDRGGFMLSNSASEIRKRKRVWMVIQRWSRFVVDEQTDLSRGRTKRELPPTSGGECRGYQGSSTFTSK